MQEENKYQMYYDFQCPLGRLKAHQILAINRGEKQKYLSVSIQIPEGVTNRIRYFVEMTYFVKGKLYQERATILERAYSECLTKKCKCPPNFLNDP